MTAVTVFRLLGPVEVVRDGRPAELGGPKQRTVLALLLLEAGRVVSTDRLLDAVWGDDHPPSAGSSLHAYISNLRRVLRDDERATSPIVRRTPGYVIEIDPDDLDIARFVVQTDAAQAAIEGGDWPGAVAAAERAAALWRGPLLVEYADEEWVRLAAAPFGERRMACAQNHVVGLLGAGRVTAALARTRELVDQHPLAERACWLHVIALHRAGRSAEALNTLREHARRMDEELGLDIGPALRDLQGAILRQDPDLDSWPVRPGEHDHAPTPPVIEPLQSPPEKHEVAPPSRSDLVGRDRELCAIEQVLAADAGEPARWIALTGAAGIGKSSLAEAAAATWERQGGRVLRTACPDDEGTPSWWPIRRLLHDLGVEPDEILVPPSGVDADAARFAAYDRILQTLARGLASDRLLLVIEDVHWADRATLRFLTHLADLPQLAGLAVVITVRDGAGGPEVGRLLAATARRIGSRQLVIPPLTDAEVYELAGRVSGEAFDPIESRQLFLRTGGNPFFVCEYARLPADERASGEIPIAVRSVLGRRLAALDPVVLQVLRTAAIIGDALDIDLLGAITQLDRIELADVLDDAADEHVIVPAPGTGAYKFAHALLRDEIVAGMSTVRRQRQHLRVAEAVGPGGGSDHLARRAAHLVAAGPLADSAEVFDACRAAALDAEQRWLSESAARWWGHAIEAHDQRPSGSGVDRSELVIAQVAAAARAGRGQTVLDVIDAGLLDAVRRGNLDSAGRLASTLLRTSGSWPWAVYGTDPGPLLSRLAGLESVVRDDPAARVRVLAALAVGSCYDPDPDVPDRLSQRALDLAETLDDDDVLADALLGRALTFSGVAVHAAESVALLDRLATMAHRTSQVDEVITHGLQFLAKLCLGDVDGAAEHLRLGSTGSDLLRLPTSRVQFRWAEANLVHLRGGDLGRAEALYQRALELHKQTELYESGVFDVAMLTLRWDQGQVDESDFVSADNPRLVPWAQAVCAAANGDPGADALIAAELARVEPPIWTTHGRLTMLAHAVAEAGLAHHVPALLHRLLPLSQCIANIGQVGVVGPVATALARMSALTGDLDGARAHLATALTVATRAESGGSVLRARLVAAEIAQRAGDPLEPHELRSISDEARDRGMLGVQRTADSLLR